MPYYKAVILSNNSDDKRQPVPLASAMLGPALRACGRRLRSPPAAAFSDWHKPALGSELPQPGDGRLRTVTLLPGDGVGPEVIKAAQEVIAATGAAPGRLEQLCSCSPVAQLLPAASRLPASADRSGVQAPPSSGRPLR